MSEERIRLKDLADELNVQHKDMLRAVQELKMPAKSISGSVTTAESERLRQYFKKNKEPDKTEENKPNVIVRKRRNENRQAQPEATDKTKTEHKDHKERREHRRNDNRREPREAGEPSAKGDSSTKTDKPSDQQQQQQHERQQSERRRRRNDRSNADRAARRKLRSLLETNARVISKPAPKVPPQQQATEEAKVVPQQATSSPVAESQVAKPVETPKVVTPKPEPVVVPPKPEAVVQEQDPAKPATTDKATVVENPAVVEKAEKAEKVQAEKVEKKAEKAEKTADKNVASPTAKIIRTPNKPAEPRVRIISRPDKPATPKPAPANKERPARGNRENRDNKDKQRSREQRNARPNKQGSAKFSEKADKFAGYRQQADSMPLPDTKDGQNKRKRLKGRRTPDFQRGDFGFMEEENVPRMNRSRIRRKPAKRNAVKTPITVTQPLKAAKRKLRVAEFITVADMAKQMGLKANELIKALFGMGVMATINQSLDIDTATLLASEFSYEVEKTGFSEDDYLLPKETDTPESLQTRPPVVTIMGHVDHGKTSLLDAIRKTHVTSGEAGGITQHIGAYHVKTKRGDIVFLDTPGHEAFTAMRARGAQITDLVILVVAADDGVMEQTKEAISHSRAANVPIMVAVNKMDKPGADPDRVLRELAELGLQAEDWGGDTIVAKVSAKTRQGLDELLEMVALQSEIMELKANPNKTARGHIVEARLDKGRGAVATVLIQEGTLHHGDNFVCGQFSGRVRSLLNDQGKKVKEAGPSMPVEVQGFDGVPEAGEEFIVVADEKVARRIADSRATKQRERSLASESRVTLETFLAQHAGEQEVATLNLVLKADVQGSLEAVSEAVNKLSTEKVRVHIVHGGTGAISESDILLASASGAIVIGFNVKPTAKMREVAEHENIDIRFYDIIYKLVEDIKNAMAGLLAPVQKEVYLGQAEVRNIFNLPKVGTIAGCYVSDGKMQRNAGVRLLRDGVVVYTGKIASLKRFKDDAREVVKGNECGVGLENFGDIKIGDVLEAFETVEEAAKL